MFAMFDNRPCRTAVLCALGFLPAAALGAIYTVDPAHKSAADANPGTPDKPLASISAAAKLAQPGDTVLIQGGVYRESLSVPRSGEPGKPITYKAAPDQRVVLTGAERVTGWKPCTQADVPGNPHFSHLFAAELDSVPEKIYDHSREMSLACLPRSGWWPITAGFGLTAFSDPENLTQTDPHAWDGWTVGIVDDAGGSIVAVEVEGYDPATHKITLARPYSQWRKEIDSKRDRYRMQNHFSALVAPGQYVFQKTEKGCRVIVWPSKLDETGQPVIEVPHVRSKAGVVNFGGKSHIVFDGLEVCFSQNHGFDTNSGKGAKDCLIQNCYAHDNLHYGVLLAGGERNTVRHCNIRRNSNGIVAYECTDLLLEENDIGPNFIDGIDIANHPRNSRIVRNFIHDHNRWGHPDNLQFWGECDGTLIDSNVFLNAGQGIMSEATGNTRVVNNLFVGSHAVLLICGGENWEIRNNTLVACATMPTNFGGAQSKPGRKAYSGGGFRVMGNIIAPLHPSPLFTVNPDSTSDYNLLWGGTGSTRPLVFTPGWKITAQSIAEIREKFNSEQHGLAADPQFAAVPDYFTCSDYGRIARYTPTKLFIREAFDGRIATGDTVEIDFDGVVRGVTAVEKDSITFEPALSGPPETLVTIANWGKRKSVDWDLRLLPESPALKANEGGGNIGCSLNLENYRRGDFNGDGKRDLPELPPD